MEPYLGEIRIFAGNFAPLGWLFCQGQLLSISEYEALGTLLGTTYGGDGASTFGLPNLSSRIVLGQGQSAAGSYTMAEQVGVENVTLTSAQLAAHTHPFTGTVGVVVSGGTPSNTPDGNYFGANGSTAYNVALGDTAGTLAPGAVTGQSSVAGGSQPHANIQPVLAINYIICTSGIYPSQP
jgi:microcystin-dependent protein